ncbi:MAG: shikimate kinase [Candidatus Altiarchaeota archaeon]
MKATSSCHGAATIITAFATGKGGAYGIGLENRTTVELHGSGGVASLVNGESSGVKLAEAAVKRTLERFNVEFTGAKVTTESDIPLAAGLKSSSVAANAIVLATIGAIASERGEIKSLRLSKTRSEQEIIIDDCKVQDEELINIGIDAAYDAKVTVTGALDDASAAYFGGYTLTDNLKRSIIYRGGMEETLKVMIYLPEGRIKSGEIDPQKVKPFAKDIDLLWESARAGRICSAITLNGLIHSLAFKQSPEPAIKALEAGAIAAGLSGTGPAVVALTRDDGKAVREAWSYLEGGIIETTINNGKAMIL